MFNISWDTCSSYTLNNNMFPGVQNLRDSIKPRSPNSESTVPEEEEDKKDDILFSAATPGSWISSTSTCNENPPLPVAPKGKWLEIFGF